MSLYVSGLKLLTTTILTSRFFSYLNSYKEKNCILQVVTKIYSDVQGLGKPPGFKGKGQEGKGQGKDFMTRE